MNQTTSIVNLEIRIFKREDAGYPIRFELILVDGQHQQFNGGYLSTDILNWVPSASANQDGETLFGYLNANAEFKQAWATIRGQYEQRRVRLRIDNEAPELHTIPWELLRDTSPNYPPKILAADADTPFSRYMTGAWEAGQSIAERPIKILVAIANPGNLTDFSLSPIDVAVEQEIIETAYSKLTSDQVQLTFLNSPVTLPGLEERLKEGYHILHIVAHGSFSTRSNTAALFLADNDNKVKIEDEINFKAMVDRQGQKPQLVFLASCQSATRHSADAFRGIGPQLIAAGIPAVLAMQDFIPVKTTEMFTHTFYRQLIQHGQVDLAGNEARSALLTGGFPGSSIPVLFSRLVDNQLLTPTKDRSDGVKIFFSYVAKDGELRDDLATHLAILKRQGKIDTWYDGDVDAGWEQVAETNAELNAADIILLLVSPRFMASDQSYLEMQQAVERHQNNQAVVIPIILRPTMGWEKAPFGKLQALPRRGKPVTSWPDRDEAMFHIAEEIRRVVEKLMVTPKATPSQPSFASSTAVSSPVLSQASAAEYNTATIRRLLKAAFTDEDFTIFCFDNFGEVHDQFSAGMSFTQKTQRLIEYCEKKLLFDELLRLIEEENRAQYQRFQADLKR